MIHIEARVKLLRRRDRKGKDLVGKIYMYDFENFIWDRINGGARRKIISKKNFLIYKFVLSLSLSLPIYIIMKVGAVMNCEKDKMKNVKSVTTSGNIQC